MLGSFDSVAARLAENHHRSVNRKTRAAACALIGKIFNRDGQPMRASFGHGRGKKIYRYYVSETLLPNGQIGDPGNMRGDRLSAERIERLILSRLDGLLPAGASLNDIFAIITRIDNMGSAVRVTLDLSALTADGRSEERLLEAAREIDADANLSDDQLKLSLDGRPLKRGKTVRAKPHLLDDVEQRSVVADLGRTAHRKLGELNASPLHPEDHVHMTVPINEWTRQRVVIGLLAPDIQKALLQGAAPANLDPDRLLSRDMPLDWAEQRRFLGMMA